MTEHDRQRFEDVIELALAYVTGEPAPLLLHHVSPVNGGRHPAGSDFVSQEEVVASLRWLRDRLRQMEGGQR